MNLPKYEVAISRNRLRYEFFSVGKRGRILKVVEYTNLADLGWWNLGFGDFDGLTSELSDTVVTDNGDGSKVMATVVNTLISFLDDYPDATVVFSGSDERRDRIYKRMVVNYRDEFSSLLIISGLTEDGVASVIEPDTYYFAFLIRKAWQFYQLLIG